MADPATPLRLHPAGRFQWPVLGLVLGLTGLVVVVSYWYLLPAVDAMRAAQAAGDAAGRRKLAAASVLVLLVVLFAVVAGMILTSWLLRLQRRGDKRRQPTTYVDAWAEAGRRLPPPSP